LIQASGEEISVSGRLVRIARLAADGYIFVDDPQPVIKDLQRTGRRIDLFTFTKRLASASPRLGYPIEWDNYAALPVTTFDNWWTRQINNKTRNMVRQAEKKCVRVAEVPFDSALVQGIWAIYNEFPVRQGRRFAHYGKDVATVCKEEATFLDQSIFLGAFVEDTLIGFIKLVIDHTGTQAGMMNIVSMIGHRDKAPTNALVAQAVRSCADRGIQYLVYSRYVYGNRTRSGISRFKEHNGFQRIDVPRYYVPLSRAGRFALSLGLHRKLTNRVPESVLAPLRTVRQRWYELTSSGMAVKG
jgi:hypothetical protein